MSFDAAGSSQVSHGTWRVGESMDSSHDRANIAQHAHGGWDLVSYRLSELDDEWDVERLLEANAATVCLLGVALGAFVDRRFFYLPAVIGTFLLQPLCRAGALRVPIFRRLGVRTPSEIDQGEQACQAMRAAG
jgi:hypothetical protein